MTYPVMPNTNYTIVETDPDINTPMTAGRLDSDGCHLQRWLEWLDLGQFRQQA